MRIQILNKGNFLCEQGYDPGQIVLVEGQEVVKTLPLPFTCVPYKIRPKGLKVNKLDPRVSKEFFKPAAIREIQRIHRDIHWWWYWGPEFLVDIPSEGLEAWFFFCTASFRELSADFHRFMEIPVSINLEKIDTGLLTYFLPTFEQVPNESLLH